MSQPPPWLEIEQIIGRLPLAVDRVMCEGGLYDERTAARAFRQAQGDPIAAANLVQALRAALPRFDPARVVERRGTGDDLQEVHHDELPVVVAHPITGEPVTIGHIRVTEAEVLDDGPSEADRGTQVRAGYGICFGHNDRKAIAAAQLDVAQIGDGDGVSAPSLLERLRRCGECGVGSPAALGG